MIFFISFLLVIDRSLKKLITSLFFLKCPRHYYYYYDKDFTLTLGGTKMILSSPKRKTE
jgi:hypothetical protein